MDPDDTISQAPPTISSTSSSNKKPPATANPKPQTPDTARSKAPSWLTSKAHKLSSWLATSEPSAQALAQHRKESFKRAGLSRTDAESRAKLHAPIGDIPRDAIRPATGPTPEQVVFKKAAQQQSRRGSKVSQNQDGAATGSESEGWSLYTGGLGSGSGEDAGGAGGGRPYTGSSS